MAIDAAACGGAAIVFGPFGSRGCSSGAWILGRRRGRNDRRVIKGSLVVGTAHMGVQLKDTLALAYR